MARMNYAKAIDILDHLREVDYPAEEVMEAIDKALSMETINAVTKDNLVSALRWMVSHQEKPRMMTAEDVAACEAGTVLWVEERQGVTWNLFPLEIDVSSTHPDTGTNYLFFITYHDIRKFECDEYNRTWRCWTERPTDEQRKAVKWDG